MKVPNIKHFLVCLIWGIGYQPINAQGLTVHMTDGTNIKVPFEKLDSITTYITEDESASIIGTWRCNTDDGYKTLTFNMDGTGVDYEYWEYDNDSLTTGFTWRTKGDVLTFIYDDETGIVTCTFVVAPEILIIDWGQDSEAFVKSAGENEDPNTDPNYPVRGPVARSFKGSGTKSDPYIISKASELRKLADDVTDKGKAYVGAYFSLTADITINKNVLDSNGELSGYGDALEEWKPIGMQDKEQFQGTFNGNGHTISGIYINKEESSYMALFYGGSIQNLTIKDSYIEGNSFTSSFGGDNISNCVNYGTIKGRSDCCGIGGFSTSCNIVNCKNYGKVSAEQCSAGITNRAAIDKCINYGVITSNNGRASGLSCDTGKHGSIKNSCNEGRVIGLYVAGISYNLFHYSGVNSDVINNVNYGSLEGTSGGGIINTATSYYDSMENNVNVGRNEGGSKTYGLYYSAYDTKATTMFKNNYYLSSSYLKMGEMNKGYYDGVNNKGMTEEEMKSQTFLDELNRNARALGSEYSRWKFGKDGFPILEWIEE